MAAPLDQLIAKAPSTSHYEAVAVHWHGAMVQLTDLHLGQREVLAAPHGQRGAHRSPNQLVHPDTLLFLTQAPKLRKIFINT
jgi:hypothetical protein